MGCWAGALALGSEEDLGRPCYPPVPWCPSSRCEKCSHRNQQPAWTWPFTELDAPNLSLAVKQAAICGVTPGPCHLARMLNEGKINRPWSGGTSPSAWLWLAGPQPGGAVSASWLGWWPERRKPTQNGDGGEGAEPSGKLELARHLTGHLGEMRAWSNGGVAGEGG